MVVTDNQVLLNPIQIPLVNPMPIRKARSGRGSSRAKEYQMRHLHMCLQFGY